MKNKAKRKLILKNLLILLSLTGILIAAYPFYVDALNGLIDQNRVAKMQKKAAEKQEKAQKKAEKYNQRLKEEGLLPGIDPFTAGLEKNDLENADFEKHLIGSVSVPKIRINLPLFDQTNDQLLDKGATVLQGTSYPTGGQGTHTVISAHSGLPNRRFFNELEKLKKQDLFILNVYGEKLAYQVEKIQIVEPEETAGLKIVPDQDLATLVTCTPYMVNSHRLLLTGHRVPYTKVVKKAENTGNNTQKIRQILTIAATILGILLTLWLLWRNLTSYRLKKQKFDFVFQVVDLTGQPVSGKQFTLMINRKKAARRKGQVVTAVSDEKGVTSLTALPGARYDLMDEEGKRYSFGVKKLKDSRMLFYKKRQAVASLADEGLQLKVLD